MDLREPRVAPMVVAVPAFVFAALAAAPSPARAQDGERLPPIAVEVGLGDGHRGFFDSLLSEDTEASERDVERALASRPWVFLARRDGEVTLEVTRRSVSESSRGKVKDGKLTVTWRYVVRATIRARGERGTLEATSTSSEELKESEATRSRRETWRDGDRFRQLGREIAGEAADWILARIDLLRPERPDAGFRHEVKHKWLVAGDGLEVREVAPGSPAALAGLEPGDRIRAIDAEKGTSEMDLRVRTWWFEPRGRRVRLEVERGKSRRSLECALLPPREWGDGFPRPALEPAAGAGPSLAASGASAGGGDGNEARLRPGMRPEEVEGLVGRPLRKVAFEAKTVWTYDGFRVVFVDGVVADVE